MKLKVNGQEMETGKATVAGLIEELGVSPGAVEVNLSIVRKCDYGTHVLRDGDRVEIVNFVGGG